MRNSLGLGLVLAFVVMAPARGTSAPILDAYLEERDEAFQWSARSEEAERAAARMRAVRARELWLAPPSRPAPTSTSPDPEGPVITHRSEEPIAVRSLPVRDAELIPGPPIPLRSEESIPGGQPSPSPAEEHPASEPSWAEAFAVRAGVLRTLLERADRTGSQHDEPAATPPPSLAFWTVRAWEQAAGWTPPAPEALAAAPAERMNATPERAEAASERIVAVAQATVRNAPPIARIDEALEQPARMSPRRPIADASPSPQPAQRVARAGSPLARPDRLLPKGKQPLAQSSQVPRTGRKQTERKPTGPRPGEPKQAEQRQDFRKRTAPGRTPKRATHISPTTASLPRTTPPEKRVEPWRLRSRALARVELARVEANIREFENGPQGSPQPPVQRLEPLDWHRHEGTDAWCDEPHFAEEEVHIYRSCDEWGCEVEEVVILVVE